MADPVTAYAVHLDKRTQDFYSVEGTLDADVGYDAQDGMGLGGLDGLSVDGMSAEGSDVAMDTAAMSGNFFSQLDSMIAAVKVESSALDSMKEKLREVENLRVQIGAFTKRLLDADQSNLTLKQSVVKGQEMYAELKRGKAE
ncbi:hypothetical protein B484DRAFT_395694, partial [Ochromonadaceae sp. CCMP2298]